MSSKQYQLSAMGILIVCLLVGVFVFLRPDSVPEEGLNREVNYIPTVSVTEPAPEPNRGATLFIPAGQWPTMPVPEPNEASTDDVNED